MVKAVVAGASGGIGQPLSLLLKLSPHVDELALYDVVNTPGVATDLSHISSVAKTTGYLPKDDGAKAAFKDADIIVIPAGIPRTSAPTPDSRAPDFVPGCPISVSIHKEIMATLHLCTSSPSFTFNKLKQATKLSASHLKPPPRLASSRGFTGSIRCYKVLIEHQGETTELEVDPDETILAKALDTGMSVPHDCKLGVCMTCPARLISGSVDQNEGMLSDDVIDRGYALLCAAYPRSDCHIRTIPEDELLSLQLATAND